MDLEIEYEDIVTLGDNECEEEIEFHIRPSDGVMPTIAWPMRTCRRCNVKVHFKLEHSIDECDQNLLDSVHDV